MRTFSIITLGCKVNQYEGQQIRQLLEQVGLVQVDASDNPDLAVVNTCCVTHTASAKSRRYIRRAQKRLPRDSIVVVTGCLPTVHIGELNDPGTNIYIVRNREAIAAVLRHIVTNKSRQLYSRSSYLCRNNIKTENSSNFKYKSNLVNQHNLPLLTCFKGHTRAFLKVQDGCDGCCTYCIVPKTRPFVHSKPAEQVVQEARALVGSGHKEIVVTGVFLGAYGQKSVRRRDRANQRNDKLAELLDRMAQIPNLARIRLSSLEPADVTPQLIDILGKRRNIMPHLHLSLQSGSNTVLKRMRRQYTVDEFRHKVELIKSSLDRAAITTDIIAGFPGETDADFEQTIDLVKEIGFAKMHIFRFSPRKGTAAARMRDRVDDKDIKIRAQILRDLDIKLGFDYRQQFIGQTATVLTETGRSQPYGRSERYFMVYIKTASEKLKENELVKVKLIENRPNEAVGQVVS